ncbi:hypothetical protein FNT36_22150 [Hymenobacter setariae]|uniref:HNH nuclease domain-containing protein n=1 Tax=Hymenobacter setariae TaxID=2594794 RepID=A0A558BMX9_9BACT|nr:hypothetical protein [Hymenobacter setariae]TVT37864.1 hypothetical protein FNT36_22150 [Hymenobacter setariae]
MVKIEHSEADLKQFALEHHDALLLEPYNIYKKLRTFDFVAARAAPYKHKSFARILKRNFRNIILATPDKLNDLANILKPRLDAAVAESKRLNPPAKGTISKYEKLLLKVFDYDLFVREKKRYYAYDFAEKLGVNVCPYCNRQYTFTIRRRTGKTRPELDHFYNKAAHPYFGLSFFNLVPSCHICNANLKRDKSFTTISHLNPYSTCFQNVLNFTINVKTADFINGKQKSFAVSQKAVDGANSDMVTKAQANSAVFHLQELYNKHQDLVVELLQKAYYYTPSRREELFNFKVGATGKYLFDSPAEVNRFITGVYTEVKEYGKRPMSKLITDIGKELGLL